MVDNRNTEQFCKEKLVKGYCGKKYGKTLSFHDNLTPRAMQRENCKADFWEKRHQWISVYLWISQQDRFTQWLYVNKSVIDTSYIDIYLLKENYLTSNIFMLIFRKENNYFHCLQIHLVKSTLIFIGKLEHCWSFCLENYWLLHCIKDILRFKVPKALMPIKPIDLIWN